MASPNPLARVPTVKRGGVVGLWNTTYSDGNPLVVVVSPRSLPGPSDVLNPADMGDDCGTAVSAHSSASSRALRLPVGTDESGRVRHGLWVPPAEKGREALLVVKADGDDTAAKMTAAEAGTIAMLNAAPAGLDDLLKNDAAALTIIVNENQAAALEVEVNTLTKRLHASEEARLEAWARVETAERGRHDAAMELERAGETLTLLNAHNTKLQADMQLMVAHHHQQLRQAWACSTPLSQRGHCSSSGVDGEGDGITRAETERAASTGAHVETTAERLEEAIGSHRAETANLREQIDGLQSWVETLQDGASDAREKEQALRDQLREKDTMLRNEVQAHDEARERIEMCERALLLAREEASVTRNELKSVAARYDAALEDRDAARADAAKQLAFLDDARELLARAETGRDEARGDAHKSRDEQTRLQQVVVTLRADVKRLTAETKKLAKLCDKANLAMLDAAAVVATGAGADEGVASAATQPPASRRRRRRDKLRERRRVEEEAEKARISEDWCTGNVAKLQLPEVQGGLAQHVLLDAFTADVKDHEVLARHVLLNLANCVTDSVAHTVHSDTSMRTATLTDGITRMARLGSGPCEELLEQLEAAKLTRASRRDGDRDRFVIIPNTEGRPIVAIDITSHNSMRRGVIELYSAYVEQIRHEPATKVGLDAIRKGETQPYVALEKVVRRDLQLMVAQDGGEHAGEVLRDSLPFPRIRVLLDELNWLLEYVAAQSMGDAVNALHVALEIVGIDRGGPVGAGMADSPITDVAAWASYAAKVHGNVRNLRNVLRNVTTIRPTASQILHGAVAAPFSPVARTLSPMVTTPASRTPLYDMRNMLRAGGGAGGAPACLRSETCPELATTKWGNLPPLPVDSSNTQLAGRFSKALLGGWSVACVRSQRVLTCTVGENTTQVRASTVMSLSAARGLEHDDGGELFRNKLAVEARCIQELRLRAECSRVAIDVRLVRVSDMATVGGKASDVSHVAVLAWDVDEGCMNPKLAADLAQHMVALVKALQDGERLGLCTPESVWEACMTLHTSE